MKCKVHGYKHHEDCRYCNDFTRWVVDDYKITEKDRKLRIMTRKRR